MNEWTRSALNAPSPALLGRDSPVGHCPRSWATTRLRALDPPRDGRGLDPLFSPDRLAATVLLPRLLLNPVLRPW